MRNRTLYTLFVCALLLASLPLTRLVHAGLAAQADPSAETMPDDGRPAQQTLTPAPGLQLAAAQGYLSPPTEAPRPFTHLLVRRVAQVPAGAALTLFLRASTDGADWSGWQELTLNDDLLSEQDGPDVFWSQIVSVGAAARFWQVRGDFASAPDGSRATLERIEVNSVDAGRAVARSAGADLSTSAAVAKPPVVSRTAWGNPQGQGSQATPAYYPVNHITVHHTADASTLYPSEPNWAARVRAEWTFHTYTRGWGDVGYNYLIDPNGVIYEGRAGGDDAVGFHDTANYGSMGVVIIGTYTDSAPSPESQASLVRLMAWKAAQKRIDPLGKSYYYGCAISKYCLPSNPGAIVLNIAGHRQVTPGHTTCPGDALMALMPGLRNRVAQQLRGTPADNGDLQIDELESSFARSDAAWYEAACGAGGHTFYTYTTDSQTESTNSATWRPNLPADGSYRVYVHIPQSCGLAPPPYASARASYGIHAADGDFTRTVDQNSAEEWVDLGVYRFSAGTQGALQLYDLTGEPYAERRVLFFDAAKWVPESDASDLQLVNVAFDRTTVASGELLRVSFTVKNTGGTMLRSQAPSVDRTSTEGLNSDDNAYVYDQDECFLGGFSGSYPSFPKETDRVRVVLGSPGWDTGAHDCLGATSDYPWRWGLSGDLAPGEQQTVVGYVRFRQPGTYTIQGGIVQEYVRYFAQGLGQASVTVTPEHLAPDVAVYGATLLPEAQVYRLGPVPDNFLARTQNPLSIPRGELVGSFAWDGRFTNWDEGGPLGLLNQFLIEQTRSFYAPVAGEYTFRTTTDDGSWLWVDGQPVVLNYGLRVAVAMTGTVSLEPGLHTLAFKYFERNGLAMAGYDVLMPGASSFVTLPDDQGRTLRLGATFVGRPTITLSADDQGGGGVAGMRWSLNDGPWQQADGARVQVGPLEPGSYRLRYQAADISGNQSTVREMTFKVDPDMPISQVFLPVISR